LPNIPDFTNAVWQESHRDVELTVSILEGKSSVMPSFRGRLRPEDVQTLVHYIRLLGTAKGKKDQGAWAGVEEFEERFRTLRSELLALQQEFRRSELSNASSVSERPAFHAAASSVSHQGVNEFDAAGAIFRKHCTRCHGADGAGTATRKRRPTIPDFSDPRWQAGRNDDELVVKILEGKEPRMPQWEGKLSTREARQLVRYIRGFAAPAAEGHR
jgi:mono/diheme cytochrome c family protein